MRSLICATAAKESDGCYLFPCNYCSLLFSCLGYCTTFSFLCARSASCSLVTAGPPSLSPFFSAL